ncbi:hypothetical protein JIG36_04260 [Actinoplanes sp. LDG1-06]|uniref:DUF2613 domain-containing protein n=1 Tax=Paractinoplanes ovalisporus TaxID=2810368 RepID=A0ABS2A645_9ACTN|nr:hypothetical protein [Actinoplanes ovalisporus]MBM2614768.1 hypothetical protein [Actinoplanes ovalisporus]
MRKALPLVLAGVIALALGAIGSVALASSLTGTSADAAKVADDTKTVPGVYGTR